MEPDKDILEESPYAIGEIAIEGGAELIWTEYAGLIPADTKQAKLAAEEIRSVLAVYRKLYSDESSIGITPEGPYMVPIETNPVAISYIVSLLYKGKYTISGDLYTLKQLGLDYGSNFDEDGNEIVR